MADKVYKGQNVVVEGSLSGETLITTKMAYDTKMNIEYLGEAKIGSPEDTNRYFIYKYIYDCNLNLVEIQSATNESSVGANEVSVDTSGSFITVTLPDGGDFSELNKDDHLSLKTINNTFNMLPVFEIVDNNSIKIRKSDIPSNIIAGIVDESNTQIDEFDLKVKFVNTATKDYSKRRWDHRTRYIYV